MKGTPPAVPATPVAHRIDSRLTEKDLDEAIRWGLQFSRKLCQRSPRLDYAAVESAALDGALSAWKSFDPSFGNSFFSLYSKSIRRRVFTAVGEKESKLAHWERFGLDIELDCPIQCSESGAEQKQRIGDFTPDPRVNFEENVQIMHLLNQLPGKDRDVMKARIMDGLSCPEVAEHLGGDWTPMRVWRAEKAALPRLRQLAGAVN